MKTPSQTGHRILVVDDEPTVCRAIKLLLRFDGHEVQTVSSGEAALALLGQDLFDVIITDYSMQGMNGNQLAALIKQRSPGQPIIMATAFAADVVPGGETTGGVDHVLTKPFTLDELREAIAKVLSPPVVPPAPTGPSVPVGTKPAPLVVPPTVPSGAVSDSQAGTWQPVEQLQKPPGEGTRPTGFS